MVIRVEAWSSGVRARITNERTGDVWTYDSADGVRSAAGTDLSMFMQHGGSVYIERCVINEEHPFPNLVKEFRKKAQAYYASFKPFDE